MSTAAIIIASLNLIVSLVVYSRLMGRDAQEQGQTLLRDLQVLGAKQKELLESAAQTLSSAYENSRRQLMSAREILREFKDYTVSGLGDRAALAADHLEHLSAALEEHALGAKNATLAAALNAQSAIASRARRLEARALLLLADWKIKGARSAVIEQRFPAAEELLDEAVELIRRANDELKSDPHYDLMIDSLRRATREAAQSLRTHAAVTVRKMERLLAETERFVSDLEHDETRLATRPATLPNGKPPPVAPTKPHRP